MSTPIKNVKLSFTCYKDWDKMTPCALGKFCESCKKSVHDFTDKSHEDFLKIISTSNGKVCGHFATEQMNNGLSYFNFFKKALAAAALFFGLSLNIRAQDKAIYQTLGEFPIAQPVYDNHGIPGLIHFLKGNINLMGNKDSGKVIVSYTVDEEGNVIQPKITTGLNPTVDEKIISAIQQVKFNWLVEEGFPESDLKHLYIIERKLVFEIKQEQLEIDIPYWP